MQSFQEDGRISSKIKRLHTRARHVCVQQWVDKKWQVRWRILEKKLQSILVGWKMYARIGRSIPTQASKNEWVNSYIYPVPVLKGEELPKCKLQTQWKETYIRQCNSLMFSVRTQEFLLCYLGQWHPTIDTSAKQGNSSSYFALIILLRINTQFTHTHSYSYNV